MDKNKIKKPLYFAVLGILLVLLILWYFLSGMPSILGLFKNGAYGEHVKLDSSFTYVSAKYSGGAAVFGKDSVFGISNAGKKSWQIPFTASDPILSANGGYILAAERGGSRVLLISGGKVRKELETEGAIITATVNRKGAFAVVMKERVFKALVKVYDKKGKELFGWHSAEQNVLSVALSEDSKRIAISAVNMKDLSKLSTILQFDLRDTVPESFDVGDENLVSSILYNRGELVAIGDEALYCFKKDGAVKFRIDYEGRELQKSSIYSGGTLVLLFKGAEDGSGGTLEFYDAKGMQKGVYSVEGKVTALDTFGKYAVVTTQNEMYVVLQNGKLITKRELQVSASRALLSGCRNRIFLISGSYAGMYIL